MRKWVSHPGDTSEEWSTIYLVVVPIGVRQHDLKLAHAHLWSGHLGVMKTYNRVFKHFFWPGMKADVSHFCKTCHTCQLVGKSNQVVPPAPLHPIPAVGEPFEHVIVDCVGPLPQTKSGNHFLLTIVCISSWWKCTRWLHTMIVSTAPAITKAFTKFFTTLGLPKSGADWSGDKFPLQNFQADLTVLECESLCFQCISSRVR